VLKCAVIALLIASGWNTADARDEPAQTHVRPAAAEPKSLNELAERLAAQWMRADPISASAQQYFSGAEQAAGRAGSASDVVSLTRAHPA
jgi:hypothetical protein